MSYFKGIGMKSGSYAGRKLPLVGLSENKKHTIFNKYVAGSGVGASSVVTRRQKKKRATLTKCTPPTPIYPQLTDDEFFIVSDTYVDFTPAIEGQINALPLETTIDLGNNYNYIVDADIYKTYAESHLNKVAELNGINSLTFTTKSIANPVVNAMEQNNVINVDELLMSENYKVQTSINEEYAGEESEAMSQNIEHTFINTGIVDDDEKILIEYIMTITVFTTL